MRLNASGPSILASVVSDESTKKYVFLWYTEEKRISLLINSDRFWSGPALNGRIVPCVSWTFSTIGLTLPGADQNHFRITVEILESEENPPPNLLFSFFLNKRQRILNKFIASRPLFLMLHCCEAVKQVCLFFKKIFTASKIRPRCVLVEHQIHQFQMRKKLNYFINKTSFQKRISRYFQLNFSN